MLFILDFLFRNSHAELTNSVTCTLVKDFFSILLHFIDHLPATITTTNVSVIRDNRDPCGVQCCQPDVLRFQHDMCS